MQGIYTHIPETNHVPKQYNVEAFLSLLFMASIYYYYYYYCDLGLQPSAGYGLLVTRGFLIAHNDAL
jgi:hypothetical protein